MIQEDDLNILGITAEEWKNMNVFKLTAKYTLARNNNDKMKMPDDLREKNNLNINAVYDQLKFSLIEDRKKKTVRVEKEEEMVSGEINFNNMVPKVNLPPGVRDVSQLRTSVFPVPTKFIKQGVVIPPKDIGVNLDLNEIVLPTDKSNGDVLVYTDLKRIALLTVRELKGR